jgi:spectinomycin phosphotransferase
MKVPYPIDDEPILKHIEESYGLPVEKLDFLPKGDIGYCYVLYCGDGSKRFMKLQDDPERINRLGRYLPTVRRLAESGAFVRLSYPLPALDGSLYTFLGNAAITLFNYIEGESLEDAYPFPDSLRRQLAQSMARFHKATPLVRRFLMGAGASETFGIGVLNELNCALSRLDETYAVQGTSTGVAVPPDIETLSAIVDRYRSAIDDMSMKVEALRPEAPQSLMEKAVICHGDLWGGNMMLDSSGELYLVDWEGLVLAPRELEFLNYADDKLMLEAYCGEIGRCIELDKKLLGFFHSRRQLQNLANWMNRILKPGSDHEQNLSDLDCIVNHCLVRWDRDDVRLKISTEMNF